MTTEEAASGLTSETAQARLVHDGPNRLVPESRGRRVWQRARVLADPMVLLLLVAAPIYVAIGDRADAVIVGAAIVPIAAIGWLLEARAERTLERLRELTAATASVSSPSRHRVGPTDPGARRPYGSSIEIACALTQDFRP